MAANIQLRWAGVAFLALLYSFILVFCLLAAPFVLILVIVGLVQAVCNLRPQRRSGFIKRSSTEVLELAERTLLQEEVHKARCEHLWHQLTANTNTSSSTYRVHCIKATIPNDKREKPPLLMLHGTAGAAVSFCWAFDKLAEEYDVYSVDMPGFGRSGVPADVRTYQPEQLTEFYRVFLLEYMQALGIEKAFVIAHSFGAFVTINFAASHPDKIIKLMLADCPGLLPTTGMYGPFFSWFFGCCLPQSFIRVLGKLGFFVMYTLYDLTGTETIKYFDLQVWSMSQVDTQIRHYFTNSFPYLNWAYPVLHKLLAIDVPLAFVYGEQDPIIPAHHAIAATNIIDAKVPVFIIGGASHNPADNRATSGHFCKAVFQGFDMACRPGDKARAFATQLDSQKLCEDYKGTYSTSYNRKLTQGLYDDLQKMVPGAVKGSVFFIGGNAPPKDLHEGLDMHTECLVLAPDVEVKVTVAAQKADVMAAVEIAPGRK